jgi:hypothetical protein
MDTYSSNLINCILKRLQKLENKSECSPDNISKGINMKCGCCFSGGYHYHYIDSQILKHKNHANTHDVCNICMKNPGKNHYHFNCDIILKNEPTQFKLCDENILISNKKDKHDAMEYQHFKTKVQSLKEFINFEAIRSNQTIIRRNIYNLDILTDGGRSNPAFSCFLFQKELNIALKNRNLVTIKEDGFFGNLTAKALQELINSYLPDHLKLTVNGKIVSEIDTSKKTADVLDKMIVDNEPFVIELLEFIEKHGHIQQHDVFPHAKNTEGKSYFNL